MTLVWETKQFDELSTRELYDIFALRCAVFIVEVWFALCLFTDLSLGCLFSKVVRSKIQTARPTNNRRICVVTSSSTTRRLNKGRSSYNRTELWWPIAD